MTDHERLLRLPVPRHIPDVPAALDKAAAALAGIAGGNPLEQLKKAKGYSDANMYEAKHAILRRLLADSPNDFDFDPGNDKYVGIKHRPTGFQIHGPQSLRPAPLPAPVKAAPPPAPSAPASTNPTNELKDILSLERSMGSAQSMDAKSAEDCPPGECCPHCSARLERSKDGVCNTCGKDWPEEKTASVQDGSPSVQAGSPSVQDGAAHVKQAVQDGKVTLQDMDDEERETILGLDGYDPDKEAADEAEIGGLLFDLLEAQASRR